MDRSSEGPRGLSGCSRGQMVSVWLDRGRELREYPATSDSQVGSCTNYVTRRETVIYQFLARSLEEALGVQCKDCEIGCRQSG
jgi:hypothetical protein